MTTETRRRHAWVRNAAFTRLTGLVKVCMECGLGMERGERLGAAERYCRGRRAETAEPPA